MTINLITALESLDYKEVWEHEDTRELTDECPDSKEWHLLGKRYLVRAFKGKIIGSFESLDSLDDLYLTPNKFELWYRGKDGESDCFDYFTGSFIEAVSIVRNSRTYFTGNYA